MSAATLAKIGARPWSVGSTVTLPDGRDGVVWSAGPAPASVWVAPDGDASAMVAVKVPTERRRASIIGNARDAMAVLNWWERARTTGVVVTWECIIPGVERRDWRGMEHSGTSLHLPECERSRVGFTETTTGGPSHGAVFTVTAELARGSREVPLTRDEPALCCRKAAARADA